MNTSLESLAIPGRVAFVPGNGGLLKAVVTTLVSTAEIYLHGAHVAAFQKNGEAPLLYLSPTSYFDKAKPIRGGVPICYPWFGPREGDVAHGFVRITEWTLVKTETARDSSVTLHFLLPELPGRPEWQHLRTEFVVNIGDRLTMELISTNTSADTSVEFENCLHTYFHVGDIKDIAITGLQGTFFFDNAAGGGGARKVEHDPVLRITKETNRIYPDTTTTVGIHDASLGRTIVVEKLNSASTVVWNPSTTQLMPDLKPEEHKDFVCVESGNIKQNKLVLSPGQSTMLKVVLNSAPLPQRLY